MNTVGSESPPWSVPSSSIFLTLRKRMPYFDCSVSVRPRKVSQMLGVASIESVTSSTPFPASMNLARSSNGL